MAGQGNGSQRSELGEPQVVRRKMADFGNPVHDEEDPLGSEGDHQRDGGSLPDLSRDLRPLGETRSERPHVRPARLRIGVGDLAHDGRPLMIMASARGVRRYEFDAIMRNQPA